MAIATFKRYEKKYLITKEMLDRILPSMLEYMELDPFCLNGVNSIFITIKTKCCLLYTSDAADE